MLYQMLEKWKKYTVDTYSVSIFCVKYRALSTQDEVVSFSTQTNRDLAPEKNESEYVPILHFLY